tara:strand:- start:413 stop:565 length:153 start_codon:yes stop_codon:yes gene_type:complete
MMAGGGITGEFSYAKTDDFGYGAVENSVSVQDWRATLLHLFGLSHGHMTT